MYLLLCPPQRLQSKNLFGLLLVRHPYISTDYVVKTQELVVAFRFFFYIHCKYYRSEKSKSTLVNEASCIKETVSKYQLKAKFIVSIQNSMASSYYCHQYCYENLSKVNMCGNWSEAHSSYIWNYGKEVKNIPFSVTKDFQKVELT